MELFIATAQVDGDDVSEIIGVFSTDDKALEKCNEYQQGVLCDDDAEPIENHETTTPDEKEHCVRTFDASPIFYSIKRVTLDE